MSHEKRLAERMRDPEFREAFAEATRLLKEGDIEGLSRLASRNVDQRAADAATRARGARNETAARIASRMDELAFTTPTDQSYESLYKRVRREVGEMILPAPAESQTPEEK